MSHQSEKQHWGLSSCLRRPILLYKWRLIVRILAVRNLSYLRSCLKDIREGKLVALVMNLQKIDVNEGIDKPLAKLTKPWKLADHTHYAFTNATIIDTKA